MDKGKLALSGLGSLHNVATQLANLPRDEQHISDTIINVGSQLETLTTIEGGNQIVAALLCAAANAAFSETGYAWRVDSNGRPSYEYVSSGQIREIIADVLSD